MIMRQVVYWIMLAIFSNLVCGEVLINEVMFAPLDGNEWIEIYNEGNETVNLSGWQLSDGQSTDELSCCGFLDNCSMDLPSYGYAIITDQDTSFYDNQSTEALKICVDDNSIGNGLGNDGDSIVIRNSSESDNLDYDGSLGKEGKSLEKNKKGEWKESIISGGTPGEKNSVYDYNYDFSILEITEIMADPLGSDGALKPLGEWVEIYNKGEDPIYLEGLVLYDEYDDHKLAITDTNSEGGLGMCGDCYKVIYRDGDNDFELSGTTEDKVRLFYGNSRGELFDEVVFAGAVEGMSWSKIEGEWFKTKPTPGAENIYSGNCDWEIKVLPTAAIFNQGQNVGFEVAVKRNYGEAGVVSVEGRVENIFGELVKTYNPWTNETITTTRTKSYTPNLQNEIYVVIFNISKIDCQDDEPSNNADSRIIVINPKYKVFESALKIEEVYLGSDEKAKWGDRLRVKVNIYKGEETKYNVELYAEKNGKAVSKRTKTSVFDQYSNYTLTLPVQLEPNCDQDFADEEYELVLTGLEKEDRTTIEIEGIDNELCKVINGSIKKTGQKLDQKILEKPEVVRAGQSFKVGVELTGDNQEHEIKLTGFVYKGPKHFSAESEKKVELGTNEISVVDLWIDLDDKVEEGEYKLKVKVNKDNQKTDKEIIETIMVEKETEMGACTVTEEELAVRRENFSVNEKLRLLREVEKEGKIVFLSSSYETKRFLPLMIVAVFGLLCLILICKKV